MGQAFMSNRRCTLTTSTALTINVSEWMSMCVSVIMCVQRERKQENKTEANVTKRSQKEGYHRQKNPVATLACCVPLFFNKLFLSGFLAESLFKSLTLKHSPLLSLPSSFLEQRMRYASWNCSFMIQSWLKVQAALRQLGSAPWHL